VLIVAVVIGLALLSKSSGVIASPEAGGAKPAGSTTTTGSTQSTVVPVTEPGSQTTRPPKDVQVIVLNASGQKGVASKNDALVKAAGFTTIAFTNAPAAERTTIYFAEGYEGDAQAVKQALKLTAAPVEAAPAAPVVPAAALAKVVVLIGTDYKG